VGPVEWNPPPPTPSDHFCFYVRAVSPQDPITFAEVSSVSTNTRNSNNIAWRNVNIVDLQSSRSITFLVRNIETTARPVDFVVQVPAAFLSVGQVTISLSRELEQRWAGAARAESRGFALATRAPDLPEAGRGRPAQSTVYRITAAEAVVSGLLMPPGYAAAATVTFTSTQTTRASYDVDVLQRERGEVIGGIRFVVRTGGGPP
jgi:hypothetical protein